jgi:hypothetical protein
MTSIKLEYPDVFKRKAAYSKEEAPLFVPAQIFTLSDLDKIYVNSQKDDITKMFSDLSIYFQKFTGYEWGNTHYYLQSLFGTLFQFLFTKGGITIWDIRQHQVFVGEYDPARIRMTLDDFEKGIIVCSKCRDKMDYNENKSHRYFAGTYCTKCWEGGMKQIEAKETYD